MNRKMLQQFGLMGGLLAWLAVPAWGQEAALGPVKVKLSDPTRSGLVKVDLANGSISVKGAEATEVVVETNQRGIEVKESDNEVTVEQSVPVGRVELRLSVPTKTSLQLKTLTGGNIRVEKVEGELEVNGINGSVTLREVAGVVLAHSLQGRVSVQLDKVTPGKPMSFSSMNGDVEVWLPADTKADVKLETLNGTVRSDFPVQARAGSLAKSGNSLAGRINGGGPEIQLKTLNGSVFLKKTARRSP